MKTKEKIGCLLGVLRLLIVSPIWFYLVWYLLKSVNASQLAFFLFWVYMPVNFILSLVETVSGYIFMDEKK